MKHKAFAILFLLLIPSVSFAVMRADFPDQKSLQPMPFDASPNISSNINYDGSNNVQLRNQAQGQDESVPFWPISQNAVATKSRNYFWFVAIFIIVAITIILVWFYKWYHKPNV